MAYYEVMWTGDGSSYKKILRPDIPEGTPYVVLDDTKVVARIESRAAIAVATKTYDTKADAEAAWGKVIK